MLRKSKGRKGAHIKVTRGANEGLTGTVVGRTATGKRKVKLDDGAVMRGSSVVKVSKSKTKRARKSKG